MKDHVLRQLVLNHTSFTLDCLPEEIPILDNFFGSGDTELDKKDARSIKASLRRGNDWAWGTVKLTANILGYAFTEYLGCCSYKNEKDFIKDGYYADMKEALIDEILSSDELKNALAFASDLNV